MLNALGLVFTNLRFADILDVAFVAFMLYWSVMWLRQRSSRSIATIVMAVATLYIASHLFQMYLTTILFKMGLTAILVAIVLIFQEDIRRYFEYITQGVLRNRRLPGIASSQSIEALIESISWMAHERIGALIVIRGQETLDRHIRGGIFLNGRISVPVIGTLFFPRTPAHDGAIIIDGDRIERFKVHLPLSDNIAEVKGRGTRHTAALGISEKCDAMVVVVSEERGTIAIAQEGRLDFIPAIAGVRERLENFYERRMPQEKGGGRSALVRRNLGLKIASILTAITLWAVFAMRVDKVHRTMNVPIELRNIPGNWVIESTRATDAQITLSGVERAFQFDPSQLVISIDMSSIREGRQDIYIADEMLNKPAGVQVEQIVPRVVRLTAYRTEQKELPVKVRVRASLPSGLRLVETRPQPATVRALIRQSRIDRDTVLYTEPIDLSRITQTTTLRCRIIPTDNMQLIDRTQENIRVQLVVEKKSP